jgi:hypothetical protein
MPSPSHARGSQESEGSKDPLDDAIQNLTSISWFKRVLAMVGSLTAQCNMDISRMGMSFQFISPTTAPPNALPGRLYMNSMGKDPARLPPGVAILASVFLPSGAFDRYTCLPSMLSLGIRPLEFLQSLALARTQDTVQVCVDAAHVEPLPLNEFPQDGLPQRTARMYEVHITSLDRGLCGLYEIDTERGANSPLALALGSHFPPGGRLEGRPCQRGQRRWTCLAQTLLHVLHHCAHIGGPSAGVTLQGRSSRRLVFISHGIHGTMQVALTPPELIQVEEPPFDGLGSIEAQFDGHQLVRVCKALPSLAVPVTLALGAERGAPLCFHVDFGRFGFANYYIAPVR